MNKGKVIGTLVVSYLTGLTTAGVAFDVLGHSDWNYVLLVLGVIFPLFLCSLRIVYSFCVDIFED